jgi:hypothetical protein
MGVSLSAFGLASSGYEQDLARVRSALDEATFEAAWAEGRAMSFEQAVGYVLGEPTTWGEEGTRSAAIGTAVWPEAITTDAEEGAAALRVFALGRARGERDGVPLDSPTGPRSPASCSTTFCRTPRGEPKSR